MDCCRVYVLRLSWMPIILASSMFIRLLAKILPIAWTDWLRLYIIFWTCHLIHAYMCNVTWFHILTDTLPTFTSADRLHQPQMFGNVLSAEIIRRLPLNYPEYMFRYSFCTLLILIKLHILTITIHCFPCISSDLLRSLRTIFCIYTYNPFVQIAQ